jgi:hypothetical protein
MSGTSVKLLHVALEIAGGRQRLARYLGIDDSLLGVYLADRRSLPDRLLLRAVDLILADRQARVAGAPTTEPGPSDGP